MMRRFRLRTESQCARFVDALGFCFAFSGGPGRLPGVFDVIGTRSVDRMWSWAWRWKDNLATRRRVFYGRVLRRKPTFISLHYLPHFYALSGNVGEEDDCQTAYEAGKLSLLARDVYNQIARTGPLTTWDLRRRFVPRGSSGSRFHRALDELQERFLVAKVGEVQGRGNYAFIWDTFVRWMPEVVDRAGALGETEAAAAVLRRYLETTGSAAPSDVANLFRWSPPLLQSACEHAAVMIATHNSEELWTLPDVVRRAARLRA